MKKLQSPTNPAQPFQTGQVWELKDSCLRIGDVGKLLVYYRNYKGKYAKGPFSLTSKLDLGKYPTDNKAILVQE